LGIFKKNIFDISATLKTFKADSTPEQTLVDTALNYLLSIQNADGGWGISEVEKSNVYMTPMLSITLKQFSETPQLLTSIARAANYLITEQNVDGGFGPDPSALHETALAYIALIDNEKNNAVLDNARNYLITMQFNSSSLNDDANSTVSALRALCFENSKQTEGLKPDHYWHDCGMARYRNKQVEALEPDKGSITGQVIDSATKTLLKDVSVFLESNPEIRTMTDMFGRFDLSDVVPGKQKITVTLAEYAPESIPVDVNSSRAVNVGTVTLLPSLPAGFKMETATDATEDQDRTAVTAESKEDKTIARIESSKKDFKRKVSIAMRRRGGYGVVGPEPEIIPASGSPSQEPQSDITASPKTGTIVGSVFDSVTKGVIRDASIIIAGKPSVNTDDQGMFTLCDILPDTCRVTISKEGYANQFYEGDLRAGETMDMLVYLTPACVNTGETDTISDAVKANFAVDNQTTAVHARFDPGQLDTSPTVKTDAVRVDPEMLFEHDKTLSPPAIVPDGDEIAKVDISLEGIQVITNPVVLSATTNTVGNKIIVAFDKVMVDPSDKHIYFSVNSDNTPVSVIAAGLNKSDNAKIDLVLELPVTDGQNILLSYAAGEVTSSDGKRLASFSNLIVSNKVLPPLYGQDGFGYSGLVAQNPLRDKIFMTSYNQWPKGFYKNVLAFISGVFDGQNIWMIPANADSVIKINKYTGAMTGHNKWPAGFRKGNLAFEGGVFDGQHIWMIPANADSVVKIDKDTGVMT